MRNIKKGEELSYDYGFSFDDDFKQYPCKCGSKNCVGYIVRGVSMEIKKENKKIINNSILIFFISLLVFYYFYGYYIDENSSGSGGYKNDFSLIWGNLNFLKMEYLII